MACRSAIVWALLLFAIGGRIGTDAQPFFGDTINPLSSRPDLLNLLPSLLPNDLNLTPVDDLRDLLSDLLGDTFSIQDTGVNGNLDLFGLNDGDIEGPIAERIADTVTNIVDRIGGLEGDDVSLGDLFSGTEAKINRLLGFEETCSPAGVITGERKPDSCVGPTFSFIVDGGVCVVDETTGEVVCSQPSISIAQTPASCNLKYKEGCTVLGATCVENRSFGEVKSKTIGKDAKTLNINKKGSPISFPDLDDLPFDLEVVLVDVLDSINDR
ncbi:hypothetical protein BSKO_12427 [Bryopsis sp. KO-2023]|nr:hypothetical protein BSKO_12427 [Bryopsis sp. KO-2023]